MPILVELPIDMRDAAELADWMELNTLSDPDNSTSRQELVSVLSNGLEAEENQIEDSQSELKAQSVFAEIEQRTIAAGENYPFVLEGDLVKQKNSNDNHLAYKFCLLVSYLGLGNTKLTFTQAEITKNFEELTAKAIENYLSNDGVKVKTKVFGWPRTDGSLFDAALAEVAKDFGALNIIPRRTVHVKDSGLDVVAWNKLPDDLPGFLFLAQCAAGKNWREKLNDIKKLTDLHVTSDVSLMSAMFIPHIIPSDNDHWRELSAQTGGMFERCRIAYLANGWNPQEVFTFVTNTLGNIKLT